MEEFIAWLEPQAAQPDPKKPGHMLPARAGAVCQSTEDWVKIKTVLQQVCAKVGCSKEQVDDLKSAGIALERVTR